MIGSVFFIFNRLVEIVFLIPIIGMMVSSSDCLTDRPRGIRLTKNKTGLLRRRLRKSKPNHPNLHPHPLHNQRHRHLLVRRHPNPPRNHQTLRDIRRLRRPPLLWRLHRGRLPTPLHRQRRLRQLARRLGHLHLTGPVWGVRRTHGEPPRKGSEQDLRDAEGVLCDWDHGDAVFPLDGDFGRVFAFRAAWDGVGA